MAGQAILIDRRMGPHEGTSFFSVAVVTQFVNRIRLDLSRTEAPVVLVAIGAPDLSLPYGMMGGPILLGPDGLMTEIAEVGLGGL